MMIKEYILAASDAARNAGAYLREHFGTFIESELKADLSRVTTFDKQAEKMIKGELLGKWPSHGFIGEESGQIKPASEFTWVIDPIDGTHNFIRGIPIFGVSIGLLRNDEFYGGIIYMPCDDTLYAAEKGSGAFRNNEKIRVSSVSTISDATLIFDSGMKSNADNKLSFLSGLAPDLFNVRIIGASVRNLTWLAEGKVDIIIEFDEHLWDYAGGLTIVQEAGGKITDHNNSPISIHSSKFVASNGILHNKVFSYFKSNMV